MADFSLLPYPIINIIINYTDVIVYRYGKYMNRIPKDDERYTLLKTICKPVVFGYSRISICFKRKPNCIKHYKLTYTHDLFCNIHYVSFHTHNTETGYNHNSTYIFDVHHKYRKLVYYNQ
jgi:hypothetical protein